MFCDNIEMCLMIIEHEKLWGKLHVNGLLQKRGNSIADALELCLFCIKPSMWIM